MQQQYKRYFCLGLITLVGSIFLPISSAHAQIFKNNNTSCEDRIVEGSVDVFFPVPTVSQSIACGLFDEGDFPDCATQMDSISLVSPGSNSILTNTGAQINNCFNVPGGNPQFLDADSLTNQALVLTPGVRMGNIQTGNLDGDLFDDLAFIYAIQPDGNPLARSVQSLFAEANGGFCTR